ncbi:unnamed protein product [Clonostachys chloroleuca]|uniref:Uncharacterized protein n=1 Tax=Clonostachys chloroleuca TaxID=1926264 RepID=A0AA35LV59_9HYPO|nr:unnamed protein product [Clonostachys chloroleuca]
MMNQMQSNDIHSVADLDSARELELRPTSNVLVLQPSPIAKHGTLSLSLLLQPSHFLLLSAMSIHLLRYEEAETTRYKAETIKKTRRKEEKKSEGRRDRGKHSELEATPGFQQFIEQLRLLEEQHRMRSELSS